MAYFFFIVVSVEIRGYLWGLTPDLSICTPPGFSEMDVQDACCKSDDGKTGDYDKTNSDDP
jgi:hypothetical protein